MARKPIEPAIEVYSLNKRYRDGTWANRDITFTVECGEILAILGPNGAGKTTLVRQITTELLPTSGKLRVLGRDTLSDAAAVKELLGVMPQEASLYWGLSVWHHLRCFGKIRGLSARDARRRADELVETLGLQDHRDMTTETLSGGLKRRVLVGIATLAWPPVMVLDEPTTGLDPRSRREFWSFIRRLKNQGTTVLLTTHYMEEAEALSDRVAIIRDGRLLAIDTIDNLRAAHGLEFKVTFEHNHGSRDIETIYGPDDVELAQRARALGVKEYAVSRANLEDVFLALTSERVELDEAV